MSYMYREFGVKIYQSFQVLMAANVKMAVFLFVAQCCLVEFIDVSEIVDVCLQGDEWRQQALLKRR
jgi:hypothetical protein